MLARLARFLLTVVGLVLLAGAITFLYLGWRINHTGGNDRAQQADAIITLGALVQQNGQPGPDLRVRTLHAVSLFEQGMAPYLICTGGYHNDRLSAASVARELAVDRGVPVDRILLADGAMTTREDAASTRDLMVERGWQTAILVSHPLHLERARFLFEGHGLTVYTSPTSTDLDAIPWRTRAWLTAREAVGMLWIVMEEVGIPYDWTVQLSHWVYGLPEPAEAK
jgi:uncharacterized SAM-binding protein YcdF (DUF218 family)